MTAAPSTWDAIAAMAALTWARTRRSRTLWISLALLVLPVAVGLAMHGRGLSEQEIWANLLRSELVLLAVLCPLYAAASLGEEIDRGTMTYLWSRPLARWTVAAGKLVALTPIVAIMMVGSVTAAMVLARGEPPPLAGVLALLLGSVSLSIASTGMAMLVPRHSLVVPMALLLFIDLPVGELPMTLARVSMTHHLRALAGVDSGGVVAALAWIFGLTALWAVIGLLRLRNLE